MNAFSILVFPYLKQKKRLILTSLYVSVTLINTSSTLDNHHNRLTFTRSQIVSYKLCSLQVVIIINFVLSVASLQRAHD